MVKSLMERLAQVSHVTLRCAALELLKIELLN